MSTAVTRTRYPGRRGFNIPAIRELVWLASAKVAHLGHGIAWEMDPFPISKPQYFSPEMVNQSSGGPVDLSGLQNVLDELTPRVQVLTGEQDAPIGLDEPTKSVLDNLRLLTESVLLAADPRIALQHAFAAADGSLLDRGRTPTSSRAEWDGWLATMIMTPASFVPSQRNSSRSAMR